MCEIPNTVVMAAGFSELFDGPSIGSNDLTQLTLGVDRDSVILAPLFDEQDPGVMELIETVTRVAHSHGAESGSATADAFPAVVARLAVKNGRSEKI